MEPIQSCKNCIHHEVCWFEKKMWDLSRDIKPLIKISPEKKKDQFDGIFFLSDAMRNFFESIGEIARTFCSLYRLNPLVGEPPENSGEKC